MTTSYPSYCKGGGSGGRWEVEKSKQHQEQCGGAHNCHLSEWLHSCQNVVGTTTIGHGYCEYHMPQVLKEIVNNHTNDGVKSSPTKTKPQEDNADGMPLRDQNGMSAKENTFQDGWVDYGKVQVWTDSPIKKFMGGRNGGGGQVLPRAMSPEATSMKQANEQGGASLGEKIRDATKSTTFTLDRVTETELTGAASSCKMLPPKVKASGGLRPPPRNKAELQCLQDHQASYPLKGQRKKRPFRSNYGVKYQTHCEKRKLLLPAKPPKWKGLSTALSVMRSICHGVGEMGVIDAQARPLLIIAGKCIFRTDPPIDTPRLCTAFNGKKGNIPKASNVGGETLPPPRSADVSREDAKKVSSNTQPAVGKPLPPNVTSINNLSCTLPHQESCQATSSSIKHWPAVVDELDSWILQIVSDWLDDRIDPAMVIEKNSLSHSPKTNFGYPVTSSAHEIFSKENLGELCLPPVSKVMELPNQLSKSWPNFAEELKNTPLNAPGKKLTELHAQIREAQTVHDLSHIFEPISLASIPSAPGSLMARDIKTLSSMPIIQEFGTDDVVQEFQRQICILERENEDLKSSLSDQEHSSMFQRFKGLNI